MPNLLRRPRFFHPSRRTIRLRVALAWCGPLALLFPCARAAGPGLELPPTESAEAQHGEEESPVPPVRTAAKKAQAHGSEKTNKETAGGDAAKTHGAAAGEEEHGEEEADAPAPHAVPKGQSTTPPSHGAPEESKSEHGTKEGAQEHTEPDKTGKADEEVDAPSEHGDEDHDNAAEIGESKHAQQETTVVRGSGLMWFAGAFIVLVIAIFVLT